MLGADEIRKTFKAQDLRILKSLGQNFLIDENVLNKIVGAGELDASDTVIEIGPGLGVLTMELARRCQKVIAVEKDRKMAELLKEKVKSMGNVEIINDDILKAGTRRGAFLREEKYKVISNIPYYITSPIIKLFLEAEIQPQMMILLVQKEVAQRICAGKGKMSILALSVQIYGWPEIVDFVDKSAFYPEPKVDSAILKIEEIRREFPEEYYQKLFRLIKIGFSSKRKKLANNLAGGLRIGKDEAKNLLVKAGLDISARAQELGVEDWKRLYKNVSL